jgi:hypothetical protein
MRLNVEEEGKKGAVNYRLTSSNPLASRPGSITCNAPIRHKTYPLISMHFATVE